MCPSDCAYPLVLCGCYPHNTNTYQVELLYGHVEEYRDYALAEGLDSQVDNEGKQFLLLEDILDWKTMNEALDNNDQC
jgi:hypothetical protein